MHEAVSVLQLMNFIIRLSGPARRHFLPFLFVLPRSSTWFGVPSTRLCGSHPIDLPLLLVDLRMSSIVRDECVEDGQRCILLKKIVVFVLLSICDFPSGKKRGGANAVFCVCVPKLSSLKGFSLRALLCGGCFETSFDRIRVCFSLLFAKTYKSESRTSFST